MTFVLTCTSFWNNLRLVICRLTGQLKGAISDNILNYETFKVWLKSSCLLVPCMGSSSHLRCLKINSYILISDNHTRVSPRGMAADVSHALGDCACHSPLPKLWHILPFFLKLIPLHSTMQIKCIKRTLLFILSCYFMLFSLNYNLGFLPFSVCSQFPGESLLAILYVSDFRILFSAHYGILTLIV